MAYSLFFDGFDTYTTASLPQYWPASSNMAIGTGNGRYDTNAAYNTWPAAGLVSPTFPVSTHVTLGFAWKSVTSPENCGFYLRTSATNQVVVGFDTLRRILVGNYTSENQLPTGGFNFIEIAVVHGDAGSVEVRVDGSSVGWIPPSAMDTKAGSSSGIDNVTIGSHSAAWIVDDFYLAYGNETVFLGDCRATALPLTGNASPQDWAVVGNGSAYALLNDGSGRIESATVGETSLFDFSNLSYTPVGIHAFQIRGTGQKSDVGQRAISLLVKSGDVESESTPVYLSASPQSIFHTVNKDPATGSNWSRAALEAAKIGVRVKV